MTHCTNCKDLVGRTKLLDVYEASLLGAPFKVCLENSVEVCVCEKCGETLSTFIPDLEGLAHAIVLSRCFHERKLNGSEIKFIRKAMHWKSKDIAEDIGVTPEHFSRCEHGKAVLSPRTERVFRLYAILKSPDKLALREIDTSKLLDLIVVSAVWDSTPLEMSFRREACVEVKSANDIDSGRWKPELRFAA